ncbi:3-phosphoinositide-dependent protein kinase 1-like isoform X1 [Triticum urartu]|uniref:non-specific serine/threonine protein kinase n=3 Tax=Triticum urartu TaxID=4572 RepID=A0A8R7TZS8_TRIUA|nr:3-phosphoinositide-dependent protein kinase 1-like isoform X1 [Triticum dicoccoides]XP_048565292.1 3-phosphoinositide-dependent protein kinase 1-like isoform X1 [Triticum urartu]
MAVGGDDDMERDFAARLRLAPSNPSSASASASASPTAASPTAGGGGIAFRAPQEQFTAADFELGKIYGVGSYSKVVRARKKDTGNVYALKIMDKKFITKENKISYVKMERIVLDQLDHPGVIRLFFTFQDTYSLYMALESCEGGELFDQIVRKGRLSEDEARFYAAEIVDILEYLHSVGLIHRDVKPENLLLTSDGHIKIADFGSVKPTVDTPIKVLPNSTNERACTFVGTAAYVPPEVLNSAPATFGNDLWALGCTLFQMLSGSSPFKDASEWLIFQRIIARDLRFPEFFSDEARDLIDKLLDVDPTKRPGAGPDGYASLKKHPFFRGIDWKNIRKTRAPKPTVEANANEDEDNQDSDWLSHMGSAHANQNVPVGNNGAASSSEVRSHVSKLASIDSFDSRWQDFLEPGESVVLISKLKKINKLSNKKVQLILTNKPQLICVDPAKMVTKGNISWSDDPSELNVQVANSSHFRISTPKKVFVFEDAKQRAWQWKNAIEDLQHCQKN